MSTEFASLPTYTEQQKQHAPSLEPAFENLLRNVGFHESIIWSLRVNQIKDRETFVGLDETESGPDLGSICPQAC